MRFAGYAAVFDAVDRGGDVVRKGAFALRQAQGDRIQTIPLLFEHAPGQAIGVIEDVREDARGLRVIGRLAATRAGQRGAVLLADGRAKGLSFGYRVKSARGHNPRELTRLELVEISLVANPMQALAGVHAVAREGGAGASAATPIGLAR